MAFIDAKRIMRSGWIGFWRNGIVSIASILVMTITLSVVSSVILSQAVLRTSLDQIKNKVDITIYFKLNSPEDQILSLKSDVEKLPEVSEVAYISAADALANFKDKHANDYLTIQALNELDANPLGAYMTVKAKDAAQYESIAKALGSDSSLIKNNADIVDKVNYSENKTVIDRLIALIDGANKLGFLLTLILMAISVIITFNTIRLTIYFSKEEIGIMRLVGAGGAYVRGPFLIQGVIYGVISALITFVIFLPITYYLGRNMTGFLGINVFDYYLNNFLRISGIVLGSGILLGVFSSFLAINKYLNK
jgi:cell division transport system permease protein